MKELELMTSEEYWDKLLSVEMVNAMYSVDKTIKAKEKCCGLSTYLRKPCHLF